MHACCMTGFIKFPCKLKLASPLPSEILDPPLHIMTYHVEKTFMEQWQQFQVMALQLVPSRDAIILIVTSQGWQNALNKNIPIYVRSLGLYMDSS